MTSRHLTLRLGAQSFEQLDAESRRSGQSRSELARTLLDEGLRMALHPGIVFRPGPSGRRPGLAGGPDVWEVARILREISGPADEVVHRTADLMGQPPHLIQVALGYYADYPEEIDDWIRVNDEEAERAYAAWRRERELLQ